MKRRKENNIRWSSCNYFILVGSYFYNNITYIEKPLKEMYRAGFVEKQQS